MVASRQRRSFAGIYHCLLLLSAVEISAFSGHALQNPCLGGLFRKRNHVLPDERRHTFARFARDAAGHSEDAATQDASPTMNTALCLIPPDDSWDSINRARHVARDKTYHLWPPAIRLFHPFCPRSQISNTALDIAKLVEKYEIEPFSVVLDTWTIVPHIEQIEADLEAMRSLPSEQEQVRPEKSGPTEMDRLIAREERLGRERRKAREKKSRERNPGDTAESSAPTENDMDHDKHTSPRALLQKQKEMYETFNGPCVVCLEPDEESKERLTELRELMRLELLETYRQFSPSSSVSLSDALPRASKELGETPFRPLMPVGSFPTVTSAVEMATKLKGLVDPLTFNVTEFHLISHEGSGIPGDSAPRDEFMGNREYRMTKASWLSGVTKERTLTAQGQYGCDALVMLMGEELEVDEKDSQHMVDLILKQGSPGGYDGLQAENMSTLRPEEASESFESGLGNLEEWLDADDDHIDEGTVVVIGRTHFFSGDQREYVGMPASSVVDAKDRNSLGKGISATAPRRTAAHRRRASDYAA